MPDCFRSSSFARSFDQRVSSNDLLVKSLHFIGTERENQSFQATESLGEKVRTSARGG